MRKRVPVFLDPGGYAKVAALVAEHSGLVFASNRQVEAEAGIVRGMQHAGVSDLDAYLRLLREGKGLDHLVDELTVGETHFMRDPAQMELLRREILPALLDRRGAGVPTRVWSAGCATGEEAYSLAILLEQCLLSEHGSVLGTDLSLPALAKARAGSYTSWSMRGVEPAFLADYFRPVGGRRAVVQRIREKVRFARLNLATESSYVEAGAGGMDVILCRNVLIYFDHETAGRVAGRLFDSLAEGGVLLTAGADLFLGSYAPFEVEITRAGLLYRRPRRALFLPAVPDVRPVLVAAAVEEDVPVLRTYLPPPPAEVPPGAPGPDGAQAAEAATALVTAAANAHGAEEAEGMAARALLLHPLHASLHHLRATLLLALGRHDEAVTSAQRALYLDRSLAVAHFLLGTLHARRGETLAARRAFRNARDLGAGLQPEALVVEGERAHALVAASSAEIERLGSVDHD